MGTLYLDHAAIDDLGTPASIARMFHKTVSGAMLQGCTASDSIAVQKK
jgi:hypothetical protein